MIKARRSFALTSEYMGAVYSRQVRSDTLPSEHKEIAKLPDGVTAEQRTTELLMRRKYGPLHWLR